MKLIKQPNSNCLLYSAAMLLDVHPQFLIDEIGHDGQDIFWEELQIPRCFRGIHIEEIIDCCLRRHRALVPVHPFPVSSPYDDGSKSRAMWTAEYCKQRMNSYYQKYSGILITERSGIGHACVWNKDENKVYDPNGFKKSLQYYNITEFWMLV